MSSALQTVTESLPFVVIDITDEINKLKGEIEGLGRTTIAKAVRIGELLNDVKKELQHGEWLGWLQNDVRISQPTASRWMTLAKFEDKTKLFTMNNLKEAFALLDASKPEKRAEPVRSVPAKSPEPKLPSIDPSCVEVIKPAQPTWNEESHAEPKAEPSTAHNVARDVIARLQSISLDNDGRRALESVRDYINNALSEPEPEPVQAPELETSAPAPKATVAPETAPEASMPKAPESVPAVIVEPAKGPVVHSAPNGQRDVMDFTETSQYYLGVHCPCCKSNIEVREIRDRKRNKVKRQYACICTMNIAPNGISQSKAPTAEYWAEVLKCHGIQKAA
jgi:hypothetical protein